MINKMIGCIIISKNDALVLKKGEYIYLPKYFKKENEEPINTLYKGITKETGIKKDYLMYIKNLGKIKITQENGKENEVEFMLLKAFLHKLPYNQKNIDIDWIDIRRLRRVLTDNHESNFCKVKSSVIYNSKYCMRQHPPRYPQEELS
ncbi:MAG: hypothetical protein ACQESF_01375 [Nanobdellota archaeon]